MFEAVRLGDAAQSSLILSGLVVYGVRVPSKVIGALAGFGAGALISAISFDLIPEAETLHSLAELSVWLPYAFDRGGSWAGVWTVVGFEASMASS